MDRRLVFPTFSAPPEEYNRGYFADLTRLLNVLTTMLRSAGEGRQSTIVITNMPSSEYGLEVGTLYEIDGVVRIVKLDTSYLSGIGVNSEVGVVNVSLS